MQKGKCVLSVILILTLVITMTNFIPTQKVYGEIIPSPEVTIGIYTAQDLSDMRYNLAGSYTLMNDIDLTAFTASGDGWVPVGTKDAPFTGTLNGNGYSITGLRIYKYYLNTTSFVGGLFGYGTGMTVTNLNLTGNIDAVAARAGRYLYLGGIVGKADTVTLSDCDVNLKIKGKAETTNVGGLVGYAVSSQNDEIGATKIINCTAAGEINTSGREYNLGGIIGKSAWLYISNTVNNIKIYGLCTAPDKYSTAAGIVGRFTGGGAITDCTNNGVITTDVTSLYMTNDARAYAGGIAGDVTPESGDLTLAPDVSINSCVNKGPLNSDRMGTITQAGIVVEFYRGTITDCINQGGIKNFTSVDGGAFGIVSKIYYGSVIRCVNKADILCTSQMAAGITSYNTVLISECSNWGTISSMSEAAGIAIRNLEGTISKCLNAGEVAGSLGSQETYAAGITTENQNVITDCINIGVIRGWTTGGIVSWNTEKGLVTKCLNQGSVLTSYKRGGAIVGFNQGKVEYSYHHKGDIAGCGVNEGNAIDGSKGITYSQMRLKESFAGFDFTADGTPMAWGMSTVTGFPKITGVEEVNVTSVAIVKNPMKRAYLINESVSTNGLILKATLSNGRVQYLDTGYALGAYSKAKGTRDIPVYYAGESVSFSASFLYFTTVIGTDSCITLDFIEFPGAVKMRFLLAYSAAGPYKEHSITDDLTDTYYRSSDYILGKTHYFKIQPIYKSGPGPMYGYVSITFRPPTPEIMNFYRSEKGAQMDCEPLGRIDGYEMYCATSISGAYTKVASSEYGNLNYNGLTKGKIYFFSARTFVVHNGVKVYSNYAPIKWGRFL